MIAWIDGPKPRSESSKLKDEHTVCRGRKRREMQFRRERIKRRRRQKEEGKKIIGKEIESNQGEHRSCERLHFYDDAYV